MKKIFKSLVTVGAAALFLVACGQEAAQEDIRTVKIGVVGERNEVWEHVQEQLEENNEPVRIELVKFTEYVKPIQALEEGEIDLHAALTEIYMEQVNEDAGYSNTTIAYTTLNPMGLFSEKHTSVDEIPDGGEIAIPDDVSNESRALLLLQAAGLIELDAEKGLLPTVNDITSNPKNLKFTVLAANQTARAMTDVDASVVNNDMAADAGLVPTEDAIFLEPVADSSKPYYNVIAAREDESEDPDFQIIVDYYQTPEVEKIIDEVTNKSSIPVWE